jgi:hypothetical protein
LEDSGQITAGKNGAWERTGLGRERGLGENGACKVDGEFGRVVDVVKEERRC